MKKLSIKKNGMVFIGVVILLLSIILIAFITINNSKSKKEYIESSYSKIENIDEETSDTNESNEEVIEIELENEVNSNNNISLDNLSEEETKTTENPKNSTATYYIKVNNQANVVNIYTKDLNGDYTVPYKAMVCSIGTSTPSSGVYKISSSAKYRWLWLFGGVAGQYCTRITGHILFHSVPYLSQSPDQLEYWEFDKLGTKASMGCIRLMVKDALWIYQNCGTGTCVEFYSSADPGPLGKPVSPKISGNENCRNWDPTDPSPNNPWLNQNAGKEDKEDKKEITITVEESKEEENLNDVTAKDEIEEEQKNEENKTNNNETDNEIEDESRNEIEEVEES